MLEVPDSWWELDDGVLLRHIWCVAGVALAPGLVHKTLFLLSLLGHANLLPDCSAAYRVPHQRLCQASRARANNSFVAIAMLIAK